LRLAALLGCPRARSHAEPKEDAMEHILKPPMSGLPGAVARSHDLTILASVAIVAIGLMVAVYVLTVSPNVDANDIASMVVYP
jgi:hypothetical protein